MSEPKNEKSEEKKVLHGVALDPKVEGMDEADVESHRRKARADKEESK